MEHCSEGNRIRCMHTHGEPIRIVGTCVCVIGNEIDQMNSCFVHNSMLAVVIVPVAEFGDTTATN